jgi:hypothetical protein
MKVKLPKRYAEILKRPYLDPSYFMVRCPKCREIVDKRKHKCGA